MGARALLLVVLLLIGPASAQSPPVVPYPRDYKNSLVKYAVVDRSDGMSRDLYVSPEAIDALKRDTRLQEFLVERLPGHEEIAPTVHPQEEPVHDVHAVARHDVRFEVRGILELHGLGRGISD